MSFSDGRLTYDEMVRVARSLPHEDLARLVAGVWDELDEKEWDSGTASEIAGTLNSFGLTVGEPHEHWG
ncbi:MAG: hypothetical protein ACYST6_19715 [Planctomycetota bacterium]|jgi:hypothetical protein